MCYYSYESQFSHLAPQKIFYLHFYVLTSSRTEHTVGEPSPAADSTWGVASNDGGGAQGHRGWLPLLWSLAAWPGAARGGPAASASGQLGRNGGSGEQHGGGHCGGDAVGRNWRRRGATTVSAAGMGGSGPAGRGQEWPSHVGRRPWCGR